MQDSGDPGAEPVAGAMASAAPVSRGAPDGIEALRQAAERAPGDAEAQYSLGQGLAAAGRPREAVPPLQQAVRLQADHLPALVLLGRLLIELGNARAGKAALDSALARAPRRYEALFDLGTLLHEHGRPEEALVAFDAAIEVGPETASAHHNRGICLRALGRVEDAAAAYRRATEIDPAHEKAHNNLGNCLRHLGRLAEAEQALRRATALAPDWAMAHYNLGRVLAAMARHGEAVVALRRAIRLAPGLTRAHVRLGIVLQEIGQLEAARACYRQALALQPDNPAAHAYLAQIDQEPLSREVVARLEGLARSGRFRGPDAQHLHFALAQRYDQLDELNRAFEHLIAGNRLKRAQMRYKVERDLDRFEAIARTMNHDLFRACAGSGDPSPVPIFVIGMPRSGTTLIEQILASHGKVHGAGELPDLPKVAKAMLQDVIQSGAKGVGHHLTPERVRQLGEAYLGRLRKRAPHAPRIVDKMLTNFIYVGMIRLMLPNAHVIHARRHPLDTCLSIFRKVFASGLEFSYDLTELGRYYAGYARLMRHWHEVLPGFVLDVRYEELIEDQRGTTERILQHCGLEWDDRCLQFHETQRLVRTASVAQVRQPIYRSSAGAWKRYGDRLRPLIEALGDALEPRDLAELNDGIS